VEPSVEADLLPDTEPDTDVDGGQYDSSELEAFAESLADEQLAENVDTGTSQHATSDTGNVNGVNDEFDADDLMAAEDEAGLIDELDEILNEVAEIRAQSQQSKAQLAELELPDEALALASADFAEAEISVADVSAMLSDDADATQPTETNMVTPVDLPIADIFATDDVDPHDFIDIEELLLDDHPSNQQEAELAAESAAETEYLSEFADLEDDQTGMPDLQQTDDNSVARVFEGLSSVERPSKVLDEYPDLQLDENDLQQISTEDSDEALDLMLAESSAEQESLADLDDVNFDELLSGLDDYVTQVADPQTDQNKAAEVLAELEALQQSQSRYSADDDAVGLPDFVNIDKLLAATEDQTEPDAEPRALNIDVGLADFEDLIAADEAGDVDHADAGFAGQLDLVRAYIEIGDADSANHLIKEIMASDAPAHVKQEASGLVS
jgi:FimV-like protein